MLVTWFVALILFVIITLMIELICHFGAEWDKSIGFIECTFKKEGHKTKNSIQKHIREIRFDFLAKKTK